MMKDLTEGERLRISVCQAGLYFLAVVVALAICSLFSACTAPRAVEEHHHHHYEADTAAVRAQVDRQLASWHEEITMDLRQRMDEYSASWISHEDQKETVSELITVTTDSLGRSIRQEQRTITRDVSRELQQQEQRITQEYEARLRVVVDSLDDTYQSRYDSLAAHIAKIDSDFVRKTPVGDTRPWYQRWWYDLRAVFVAAMLAAAIWLTRRWWLRLLGVRL